MPANVVDPKTQLADAVTLARRYRHHPDCRCHLHRNQMGEGFCSAEEALWSRAVDRLLGECCGR